MQPDDVYWRRPDAAVGPDAPDRGDASSARQIAESTKTQPAPPWPPSYSGPPPTLMPPAGWQPEYVVKPPPARQLPEQDHQAIDADEERARNLTFGVGLLATAILIIVVCLLFVRALG